MRRRVLIISIAIIFLFLSTATAYADHNFSFSIYRKGTTHKDVKVIQDALKSEGLLNMSETTYYYGNLTKGAVTNFQKRYGLLVDGIAGNETITKMRDLGLFKNRGSDITFSRSIYKKGITHSDVSLIQKALKKAGTFNFYKITNYYGYITENAVESFQRKYGLMVDGIVGKNTINKMRSLGFLESMNTTSRSSSRKYGEYLDWWEEVRYKIVNVNDIVKVKDLVTGIFFNIKVTGGTNHADVEPLTLSDAKKIKNIWNGYSWARRAVVVYTNEKAIAASMNGMPHAGVEDEPARKWVSDRSGGFGDGINYDTVKGNGFDGHLCMHFKNSRTHGSNREDENHQLAVKKAAGLR
ncbi:MAG: peptidoglycan-binding protein [Firmicutes bacterium]|nr:peptidoglycan-binding protein [Bacillota bacterium]